MKQSSCNTIILVGLVGWTCFLWIDCTLGGTVRLAWDPNPEGNVIGYHIYRSESSGGPYTRLNPAILPSTDFRDESVIGGSAYYYKVTAVDNGENESFFSKELAVFVPINDTNSKSSSLMAKVQSDLIVSTGQIVILSGSGWALEGSNYTYSWTQIPDLNVVLVNADSAEAAFLAPIVTQETVLNFVLMVREESEIIATDAVKVMVYPR